MPRRLPGRAIQAGTITVTQLETAVANTVQTGGGPKITNVEVTSNSYVVLDDTAVDIAGGYIKITGTGFASGCQVLINNTPATSTTFVSATEVRAQVPASAAGSYIIYLVNPDGGVAIRINGITFSATPTWVTGSSLAGNVDEAISIQLSATGATSYVLAAGSTLPTGLTLSSGGLLSGTITGLVNDTSYSFTINAVDAENQDSPRSFTITINTGLQVPRSLRFNAGDGPYMTRTFGTATNRKIFTFSVWVKRSETGSTTNNYLIEGYVNDSFRDAFTIYQDRLNCGSSTLAVLRDVAAWYHLVISIDTTQASSALRTRVWINGQQDAINGPIGSIWAQNYESSINGPYHHNIGRSSYGGGVAYHNGYMAEMYLIDGQALTPASFARSDDITGQWIPKRYTGTYGTNGFYLNFSDNSGTTATTLGKDSSGNNNNFTPFNFSVTAGSGNDSLVDSPTMYGIDTGLGGEVRGNYCTWNVLEPSLGTRTIANGALDVANSGNGNTYGNFGMTTGKWYFECTLTAQSGATGSCYVGLTASAFSKASGSPQDRVPGIGYCMDGTKNLDATVTSYGATYAVNDIIGCAVDIDAGSVTFYKNGVSQGTITKTLLGQGTGSWIIYTVAAAGAASNSWTLNAGQRPFNYTAPSGFKALCTQNLSTPSIVKSNTAFDALVWSGDGVNNRKLITNFSPDLFWVKARNSAAFHSVNDSVRGANAILQTNTTSAEQVNSNGYVTTFAADGVNVTNGSDINASGTNYVGWAWDAGTTTVTNTAGTISAQVRANPTTGFSIVSYTGVAGGNSVGHGLGVAPKFIIVKGRTTSAWIVYTQMTGINAYLYLHTTGASVSDAGIWSGTGSGVTSSTFGVRGASDNGLTGVNLIAYCFAEVPGFSAFGTYTGNGSADGPFVYTGFRPAWIMIKRSDGIENWNLYDNKRNSYNVADLELYPNLSNSEGTYADRDFLSNGFKIRNTNIGRNASGSTYIYAAFAESPFKYARAR